MTEPDPHSERFVIVHRAYDPVQAEMLCGVLVDAGLNARLIGTRSTASIGAGQSIADLKIEVPASQEVRAAEVLASILEAEGGVLLRDEGLLPHERDVDAELSESPRRWWMALGAAYAVPFGGGHGYARRPWTAIVIAIAQVALIAAVLGGLTDGFTAVISYASLVVLDGIFGAIAASRRPRPSQVAQLVWGVALTAAAFGCGALVAGAIDR